MGTLLHAVVLCCVSQFRKWIKTAQSVKWLAVGWMNWGWMLGGARGFSILQNVKTSSVAHPASYRVRTTVLSRESSGRAWRWQLTSARVRGAVPPFFLSVIVVWTETTVLWFRNVTAALNGDWLQFFVLRASDDAPSEIFQCGLYSVAYQQNSVTTCEHFQIC